MGGEDDRQKKWQTIEYNKSREGMTKAIVADEHVGSLDSTTKTLSIYQHLIVQALGRLELRQVASPYIWEIPSMPSTSSMLQARYLNLWEVHHLLRL